MEALEGLALSQPLHSHLLRSTFLSRVFEIGLFPDNVALVDNAYEAFFVRYQDLCHLSITKHRGIQDATHADVLETLDLLRDTSRTREELLESLRTHKEPSSGRLDDFQASTLLDLAASTWLMLPIGPFPHVVSLEKPLVWSSGRLQEVLDWPRIIDDRLHHPDNTLPPVKLPQSFTAYHLERIAGITIHWTSNLADHLRLRDDDTKLTLFHHASALSLHATSPHPTPLLPPALAEETTRTLALLMPPVLGASNPWFLLDQQRRRRRSGHTSHAPPRVDASAGLCDRLNSTDRNIENFVYWRKRLELVKRTYDEAEPRTVGQLWHDDRRKVQWFTFWVAVLVFGVTVFFGVVQSVASIVQAWASVEALRRGNG